MPYYNYKCKECNREFIEYHSIENRYKPCENPCPCDLKKENVIYKEFGSSFTYNMIDPIKRAGSGWNDVLTKIKKGSGKNNTIRTR